MKKIFLPLLILLTGPALMAQASAQTSHPYPYVKQQSDQVVYDVTEEGWVSTDSARVIVSIDASMKEDDLGQLRDQIMENLDDIAKAQWQITQFNRSQDSSGLDRVSASAEARVAEDQLTKVYSQAEKLSEPGTSFRIQYIDFTPSLAEFDETRTQLREKIYEKVNAEIQRLNKQFPDQVFQLHQIDFLPEITIAAVEKSDVMFNQARRAALPSVVNVSTNIKLTALVTLATQAPGNEAQ